MKTNAEIIRGLVGMNEILERKGFINGILPRSDAFSEIFIEPYEESKKDEDAINTIYRKIIHRSNPGSDGRVVLKKTIEELMPSKN